MLFNSVQFFLFFPLVTLVYYLLPAKARPYWLLGASYYFYGSWNVRYTALLLFSTAVTYASGLVMEWIQHRPGWSAERIDRGKRLCVAGSFMLNLSVLFLFKYANFAFETLGRVFAVVGMSIPLPTVRFLLPVGISFYTFQALSYTMDVYRGDIYAEKNFFRYALFVSFFPQLVAGPIERSKNLLVQLAKPVRFDWDRIIDGLLLMVWGFFLKLVIADSAAIFVNTVYGDYVTYGGWYLWVATLLFAVQIYCDFGGYSTIAMGAAKVLGIGLMENFDSPYLARSVAEFWRRWHISLSSWFRDYLYIPLGGSRKGTLRKYFNLMVVFLVSGLWHGASWSFVVWGALNGIYQIIGFLLTPLRDAAVKLLHLDRDSFSHRLFQTAVTFALVDFSWIFFRAASIRDAFNIINSMAHPENYHVLLDWGLYQCGLGQRNFFMLLAAIGVLLAVDVCKYRGIQVRRWLGRQEYWFRWAVIAAAIVLIATVGVWGNYYNEASFIYFQF